MSSKGKAKSKDSAYWKQRFSQLEAAQNQMGTDTYSTLEKQYRQAQKQIEGQISAWYERFAQNNDISLSDARAYLKGADLEEFKWDVNDYIKYGEENAVDQQWMKQLENASAKFHISKLEALKIQTQNSLETLFAQQNGTLTSAMSDVYQSSYYHTAYEVQNGFGLGWDISALDQSEVAKVISKPWAVDGKNFSERIWGNKEKLIQTVHNELTQNIMLGRDPQEAIDAIAKQMNTSKNNAGRLVMTEEAYFSSAAQQDCFNELGVEQYQIVATLDSRTSDICRELDGQVFPMKDYQAGVTAPPFHVWCRSTTVPYFEDNFGQIGERAARDENGQTYYIPDMNYQEWKDTFVDGNEEKLQNYTAVEQNGAVHYQPAATETAAEEKPKKEYLTENKLKAKIADADVQLEDLTAQANKVLEGTGVVDDNGAPIDLDYLKENGGLDEFYKQAELANSYYNVKQQIDDMLAPYNDDIGEFIASVDSETFDKYVALMDQKDSYAFDLEAMDLNVKFGGAIDGITKEEAAAAMEEKATLQGITQQMDEVQAQKTEWEEKLKEKQIAKEKKALTKQEMDLEAQKADLQAQLDAIPIKTYSGIWKHDVTTADYATLNIKGKKDYYNSQLEYGNLSEEKIELYHKYLDDLDELEKEGAPYAEIQAKIKEIDQQLNKIKSDLTKLEKGSTLEEAAAADAGDAFSEERKNNALWFDEKHGGFPAADAYFDPQAKVLHKEATRQEENGFYVYTQGSGGFNRPLAGFQKPYDSYWDSGWESKYYVGPNEVWIDYEGKGDQIRGLTSLIEKSSYDQDVWLQSAQGYGTLEGMLGLPTGTLENMNDDELQQFVGREGILYQFISTGVYKGGGGSFNSSKPMKMNIYAPKGSEMLYASDCGQFGKTEQEMILQRGGSYKITRMYWGIDETDSNRRKIFADLELHSERGYVKFQQDPSEWKGSKKTYKS